MSRFQHAEVTSLLTAVDWTQQNIRIRLSWGYCQTLEVDCVKIGLRNLQSNPLVYQHQVLPNGQNKPFMMRKVSPAYGVSTAAFKMMDAIHEKYVSRIVDGGLDQYVSEAAYNDDDSDLPKRLLLILCQYYRRCMAAREEVCSLVTFVFPYDTNSF